MVLQIYVLSIHICIEIALAITIEIAYDTHKLDDDSVLTSSLKIVLVIVLFIGQAVLIYLLDRFSRPFKFNTLKASQASSADAKSATKSFMTERTDDD